MFDSGRRSRICSTCERQRDVCLQCSRNCAAELAALPASHECSALRFSRRGARGTGGVDWTSVERDWGSRRLASCFACCLQANCTPSCAPLFSALPGGGERQCPARECVAPAALELNVRPVFSGSSSVFYCHVEPNRQQLLYRLSFQLLFREQPLGPVQTASLRLSPPAASPDGPLTFRTQHSFLTASYSSGISRVRYITLLAHRAAVF